MNTIRGLLTAISVSTLLMTGARAGETEQIVTLEPDSVVKPYKNRFSHGKLVPPGATWLFTAGQTGVNPEGEIGKDIEEQAEYAIRNLYNIIREGGMDSEDVVKMTIYIVDPAHLKVVVAARNRYFGEDFRPASTAVGVSALARPQYLVEVEAVAAKVLDR
jgi:2-iminobutanoate/2-iminopropanoate deaminase